MYYAVIEIKLQFELSLSHDRKMVSSLCQKIRTKFKVSCAANYSDEAQSEIGILFSLFSTQQQKLDLTIDQIIQTIESEGLGRIINERGISEHIDALNEI